MGDSFIRHIALLGFEKRFVPSQHYVSSRSSLPARGDNSGQAQGCHTAPSPRNPQGHRPTHGLPRRPRVEGRDRGQVAPRLWASVGQSGRAMNAPPGAPAQPATSLPALAPRPAVPSRRPGLVPGVSQPSRPAQPFLTIPALREGRRAAGGLRAGCGRSVSRAAHGVSYVRVVSPSVG